MAVATESALIERVPTGLFIDGDWLSTPETLPVSDPSTGETLTVVADASEQDALARAGGRPPRAARLGPDPGPRPRRDPAPGV